MITDTRAYLLKPHATRRTTGRARAAGFTLVEIMMVVGIIGLLAAIAVPSFRRSRRTARVNAVANDMRIFGDGYELYAMEKGGFPTGVALPGMLPDGMAEYINADDWAKPTPIGGNYWWKTDAMIIPGITWAVSIMGSTDTALMDEIDDLIDDGDPTAGNVQQLGANLYYVVE